MQGDAITPLLLLHRCSPTQLPRGRWKGQGAAHARASARAMQEQRMLRMLRHCDIGITCGDIPRAKNVGRSLRTRASKQTSNVCPVLPLPFLLFSVVVVVLVLVLVILILILLLLLLRSRRTYRLVQRHPYPEVRYPCSAAYSCGEDTCFPRGLGKVRCEEKVMGPAFINSGRKMSEHLISIQPRAQGTTVTLPYLYLFSPLFPPILNSPEPSGPWDASILINLKKFHGLDPSFPVS